MVDEPWDVDEGEEGAEDILPDDVVGEFDEEDEDEYDEE